MPKSPRITAPLIQRFKSGAPQISAGNLNRMVDRFNAGASMQPFAPSEPRFVRTCRNAAGVYPLSSDNPRKYPFRFVTVVLDDSDPAGVAYEYSFPTVEGATDEPDGEFVNLRPSEPTIALPYRAEDTFLWIWFGNGYYWSLEPEITAGIFKVPAAGVPAMVGEIPGSAVCDMYRINESDTLEPVLTISGDTVTAKICNLGDEVAGGKYVQAKREQGSGRWVGDWEKC